MRHGRLPWEGLGGILLLIGTILVFVTNEWLSNRTSIALVIATVLSLIGAVSAARRHSKWWFVSAAVSALVLAAIFAASG